MASYLENNSYLLPNILVFFAFITVFTDYKLRKLSGGLDPHFEIPLQTLEGAGLSTEIMDE